MNCPVCGSHDVTAHGFRKGEISHTYGECHNCQTTFLPPVKRDLWNEGFEQRKIEVKQ